MANNLIISYDLRKPGRNYESVYEAIKSLGNSTRVVESTWYVNSLRSAEQAFDIVFAQCDENDVLFVVDATNNAAVWQNLSSNAEAIIHGYWER